MNTFSDREWGFGDEKPEQFNPTALDGRQWARFAKLKALRTTDGNPATYGEIGIITR